MVVLLDQAFGTLPNGPLPAGWATSGANADGTPGVLRVDSGRVHLTPGHTNGYAQHGLYDGKATDFVLYYMFGVGGFPTLCVINAGNTPGQSYWDRLNMRMHLVIRPDQIVWQVRKDEGLNYGPEGPPFESVWGAPFSPELPRLTLLGLVVNIAPNGTVTITKPDGGVEQFTDTRIGAMAGDQFVLQVIRPTGTDPEGEWVSARVSGTVTPIVPWVTLEEFVNELDESTGDDPTPISELSQGERERLDRVFLAAKEFVEEKHRGRFDFGEGLVYDPPLPLPGYTLKLGTVMLARRWHTRRRSPEMLVAAANMGAARIPAIDPDIARLLRLGRNAYPDVG